MNLAEFQLIEQTNSLYRKTTSVLLMTSICSFSLVFVTLWSHYNTIFLSIWYACSIAILLLRHHIKLSFLNVKITLDNHAMWRYKLLVFSFLLGSTLGIILMFSVSPKHFYELLILTLIYCALISTSSSYLGVYLPAYLAFGLPPTLMFVVKLSYIGGQAYFIFAGLISLFFAFISLLARNTHSSEKSVSSLTYQNNQLYNKVVSQKNLAENAVLAKNQFLAAASHDLRQPLHAQGLFITALQYSNLPQKAQTLAEKIRGSNNALNGLLNGLLDIAKLDANTLENEPEPIELRLLLDQIHQEYFDSAAEKETELKIETQGNLTVFCDRTLITRLIRNLVDNAVKFTSKGKIILRTEMQTDQVSLFISDTGKGIAEDKQGMIFNEFTQLGNPERDRKKGLGLGLAIVKRISLLMNIDLRLTSRVGQGTEFSFSLPLMNNINSTPENQIDAGITNNKLFSSLIILVIDDEAEILNGMRLILQSWNARVVTACDAEQAIEQLDYQGLYPNLIISDLRLQSGKNGVDAINTIRNEFESQIKAIVITGDTASDSITLTETVKLPTLYKPVEPHLLKSEIEQLFSKKQTRSLILNDQSALLSHVDALDIVRHSLDSRHHGFRFPTTLEHRRVVHDRECESHTFLPDEKSQNCELNLHCL